MRRRVQEGKVAGPPSGSLGTGCCGKRDRQEDHGGLALWAMGRTWRAVTPARRSCNAYPSHRPPKPHLHLSPALRGSPCASLRMRELGELPHSSCPACHNAPRSTSQPSCLLVLLLPMERPCLPAGLMAPGGRVGGLEEVGSKHGVTGLLRGDLPSMMLGHFLRAQDPSFALRGQASEKGWGKIKTLNHQIHAKTQAILIYPIIRLFEEATNKFPHTDTWCPCSAGAQSTGLSLGHTGLKESCSPSPAGGRGAWPCPGGSCPH